MPGDLCFLVPSTGPTPLSETNNQYLMMGGSQVDHEDSNSGVQVQVVLALCALGRASSRGSPAASAMSFRGSKHKMSTCRLPPASAASPHPPTPPRLSQGVTSISKVSGWKGICENLSPMYTLRSTNMYFNEIELYV